MSAIMRQAFARWEEMRDDYELRRHAQYERAVADLRGELLSARGRANHVDPYSLFMGTGVRVLAYASEELLAWWDLPGNRRMTVEEFEVQWLAERGEP